MWQTVPLQGLWFCTLFYVLPCHNWNTKLSCCYHWKARRNCIWCYTDRWWAFQLLQLGMWLCCEGCHSRYHLLYVLEQLRIGWMSARWVLCTSAFHSFWHLPYRTYRCFLTVFFQCLLAKVLILDPVLLCILASSVSCHLLWWWLDFNYCDLPSDVYFTFSNLAGNNFLDAVCILCVFLLTLWDLGEVKCDFTFIRLW